MVFGAVRLSTIQKEQGCIVTPALLADRLAATKEELLASQEITSYRDVVHSADVLDAEILDVLLDGYATGTYLNRHVGEISLSAYFSITSPQVLDRIHELVERTIPNVPISVTTTTRVFYHWCTVH